ncbi:hypothetical protein NUW58_g1135 [Xylaria curta]|uniref:Uncharacterized protein n=1 Tax=Xylaria curta TaxID=42375 RepID=A0ACC1PN06_9PEZI|nr:hypothetical protein NUW58_g1135 [Xylaria curta]
MPQNTRSRCQESRPTPPLYRQQTRRRQALSTSRREDNQHQGNNGVARAPSNTSAAFSLARNYPERPEDGPEILSTSVPTRPHDISDSSERQNQAKSSTDNASPHRSSQDAHELMTPHEANENHPENVQIIHFDFSKYRASTPGSESHPIKIEDSPNAYPSPSIHTRGLSSLQDPISGPAMPAMQHDYQSDDVSRIQNENTDGNPLMVIPANPVSSAAVSSITTSPKAATIFLHCFLASERYWLRSRDHDMDPDIKFWKKIVEHFNAKPHGYRIDAWLTARHIATTLCSQPYKTQVEQQLPGAADELSGLVSVIEDCRLLSQRRRLRQLSRFEKVKTSVSDTAPRKVLQRSVLERIPQTLEDHKKLMDVLATKCSESTQIKDDEENIGCCRRQTLPDLAPSEIMDQRAPSQKAAERKNAFSIIIGIQHHRHSFKEDKGRFPAGESAHIQPTILKNLSDSDSTGDEWSDWESEDVWDDDATRATEINALPSIEEDSNNSSNNTPSVHEPVIGQRADEPYQPVESQAPEVRVPPVRMDHEARREVKRIRQRARRKARRDKRKATHSNDKHYSSQRSTYDGSAHRSMRSQDKVPVEGRHQATGTALTREGGFVTPSIPAPNVRPFVDIMSRATTATPSSETESPCVGSLLHSVNERGIEGSRHKGVSMTSTRDAHQHNIKPHRKRKKPPRTRTEADGQGKVLHTSKTQGDVSSIFQQKGGPAPILIPNTALPVRGTPAILLAENHRQGLKLAKPLAPTNIPSRVPLRKKTSPLKVRQEHGEIRPLLFYKPSTGNVGAEIFQPLDVSSGTTDSMFVDRMIPRANPRKQDRPSQSKPTSSEFTRKLQTSNSHNESKQNKLEGNSSVVFSEAPPHHSARQDSSSDDEITYPPLEKLVNHIVVARANNKKRPIRELAGERNDDHNTSSSTSAIPKRMKIATRTEPQSPVAIQTPESAAPQRKFTYRGRKASKDMCLNRRRIPSPRYPNNNRQVKNSSQAESGASSECRKSEGLHQASVQNFTAQLALQRKPQVRTHPSCLRGQTEPLIRSKTSKAPVNQGANKSAPSVSARGVSVSRHAIHGKRERPRVERLPRISSQQRLSVAGETVDVVSYVK